MKGGNLFIIKNDDQGCKTFFATMFCGLGNHSHNFNINSIPAQVLAAHFDFIPCTAFIQVLAVTFLQLGCFWLGSINNNVAMITNLFIYICMYS